MKKTTITVSIIVLILITCIMLMLVYTGGIHLNNPSKKDYPVRGVDVSHYQGEIDWEQLSKEDISFAFIKATEGSQHIDNQFNKNWSEAQKTDLRIGAYHFFSLDSSGAEQAKHFCNTVPIIENMLPPVVDIEPYGDYKDNNNLDEEAMISGLADYLKNVEDYYSMRPIIYTTEEWYAILQDDFSEYDIWIRSVYKKPDSSINWTFWQYSNRHRLSGYSGKESYIDMNVFNGSIEEFIDYR